MKAIILLAGLLFMLAIPGNAQKQPAKRNYVVVTTDIQQIGAILNAAARVSEQEGKNMGKFEVIICGKTVTDLTDKDKVFSVLQLAKTQGVIINACGFSVRQQQVDPSKMPDSVIIVDNGIFYDFQLQRKGYLSLGL